MMFPKQLLLVLSALFGSHKQLVHIHGLRIRTAARTKHTAHGSYLQAWASSGSWGSEDISLM